ncbi:hypothetical protein ACPUEN_04615 [Algoriphagus yeomjeoni]|uniref:hypothetical protein n=1 Tax=Algoriphagus yeomjeoni TaxID=291403 RepID=UPI003CE48E70
MKYDLSLFLLLVLFLQGCHEDNSLNTLVFYWDQTSCSDPWNTNSNNSNNEILQAVEDYLRDHGVNGARVISITGNGVEQVCEACFCTTGTRINVKVPTTQKSKMIALGFKESS